MLSGVTPELSVIVSELSLRMTAAQNDVAQNNDQAEISSTFLGSVRGR